mgnify:CR=1 FL=1
MMGGASYTSQKASNQQHEKRDDEGRRLHGGSSQDERCKEKNNQQADGDATEDDRQKTLIRFGLVGDTVRPPLHQCVKARQQPTRRDAQPP